MRAPTSFNAGSGGGTFYPVPNELTNSDAYSFKLNGAVVEFLPTIG
jgi:hypothetical protein